VGYVGFTGGTGGLTTITDISSWTFRTTLPKHDTQPQLVVGGPAVEGPAVLTAAELGPVAQQAGAGRAAAGLSPAPVAGRQAGRRCSRLDRAGRLGGHAGRHGGWLRLVRGPDAGGRQRVRKRGGSPGTAGWPGEPGVRPDRPAHSDGA